MCKYFNVISYLINQHSQGFKCPNISAKLKKSQHKGASLWRLFCHEVCHLHGNVTRQRIFIHGYKCPSQSRQMCFLFQLVIWCVAVGDRDILWYTLLRCIYSLWSPLKTQNWLQDATTRRSQWRRVKFSFPSLIPALWNYVLSSVFFQ